MDHPNLRASVIFFAMFTLITPSSFSQESMVLSNLLTPGDIVNVSGIKDSLETERISKKLNGGTLNFTTSDGKQLLYIIIQRVDPSEFREEEKTANFQSLYSDKIADLGD